MAIESYKYRGYQIEIVYDEMSRDDSPADWGNFEIVMKPGLNLVDKSDKYNWHSLIDEDTGDYSDALKVMLHNGEAWPIVYQEHGLCRYALGGDIVGEDGVITADGFIIFDPEYMKNAGGSVTLKQMAEQDLENYTDWANGSVYGYQITNPYGDDGFDGDECYSIYGFEEAKREAEMAVDSDINYDRPQWHAKRAQELHR